MQPMFKSAGHISLFDNHARPIILLFAGFSSFPVGPFSFCAQFRSRNDSVCEKLCFSTKLIIIVPSICGE